MKSPDSPTPLVCRMLVRLAVADGVDPPVMVDLRYDTADPYAVSMTFHLWADDAVRWVFSRDLLLNGQEGLTGAGDVQVWPSPHSGASRVCIALRPCPHAEAVVVMASARVVGAFLRRTLAVVPAGTEQHHLDLDGAVRRLLNGRGDPRR